jgi:ABC-type bacteriocin/lantibiotic exporter with double-glycine peptidase domain
MARLETFLQNTKILPFPSYKQGFDWSCGTTAMNMILSYYGNDVYEKEIMDIAKITKADGAPIEGLKDVAKYFGLKYKESFNFSTDDLRKHVDNGWPTLIMIQAWHKIDNPDWDNEWDQGHYTAAIGYDKKRIIFADPLSIKRVFLSDAALNSRWHGWSDSGKKIGHWGLVFTNKSKYNVDEIEEMG